MSVDVEQSRGLRAVPVRADVRATLAGLGLRVGEPQLARWGLASAHQVRTLYVLEDGDGPWVAFGVHRPLAAYQKIAGVCRASRGAASEGTRGEAAPRRTPASRAVARLLDELRERARARGWASLKCEVWSADGPSGAAWREAGARAGYAWMHAPKGARADPAGGAAPELLVWSPHAALCTPRAYMRQTTGYTCGPVALLMGLAARRPGAASSLSRGREIALWRAATMLDGCGPFGLALAARRLGARVRVVVSERAPLRIDDAGEPAWKARMRADAETGFARRCAARGIPVRVQRFGARDVAGAVAQGSVALVLIDQHPMHAQSCPHWIAVTHVADGRLALCQDPWTDERLGETWADGDGLPLPLRSLDRLAAWGERRQQACVLMRP